MNFYTLITFTMKTAFYEEKFKKTLNERKLLRLKEYIFYLFLRSRF